MVFWQYLALEKDCLTQSWVSTSLAGTSVLSSDRSDSDDHSDRSVSPSPSIVPTEDRAQTVSFSIKLLFPDGGAPTIIYPVYSCMPVSILPRLRLLLLLLRLVGPFLPLSSLNWGAWADGLRETISIANCENWIAWADGNWGEWR